MANKYKLNDEEKDILDSFERDEWKSVSNKEISIVPI